MLEIPEDLGVWTFETVEQIVREREYEPGNFDYKSILTSPRMGDGSDLNLRLRKTVCSMANTDGGFILFGVKDREHQVSSPEERIVGIPAGDHRRYFGEKLGQVKPDVHFDTIPQPIPLPNEGARFIFVAYIPQSLRRPHMVMPEGAFYRRGDGGHVVTMDYYEVREQMMYTEGRLNKVRLFRLQLKEYLQSAIELSALNQALAYTVVRFDLSSYKPLLADICEFGSMVEGILLAFLELYRQASQLNRTLDRIFRQQLSWEQLNPINAQIRDISERCQKCENYLATQFGSL